MFGRRKKVDEVRADTIDTAGRFTQPTQQAPPTMPQHIPPPPPQYVPPPPQPPMSPDMQAFVQQYRIFGPESFTAPGVYEATVCNLLYGIYAELYKANTQQG